MAKDISIQPMIITGSTTTIMLALYQKRIGLDVSVDKDVLKKLSKLDALAASAFATKYSLEDANHTNNSIQHLLPYVTISDRTVVSNFQTEALEYENKIKEQSKRNEELNQLYDVLKKSHADCQNTLAQGKKITLADFQILDSNTTKFIKKVAEFNIVLTNIVKNQDALYDKIEKVTPIAQRVEAPKRPDEQGPSRRSFGS